MSSTSKGLAVYGRIPVDLGGSEVVVRRCYGARARVVITAHPAEGDAPGPPELDVAQAKVVRDALDLFIRRASVSEDGGIGRGKAVQ